MISRKMICEIGAFSIWNGMVDMPTITTTAMPHITLFAVGRGRNWLSTKKPTMAPIPPSMVLKMTGATVMGTPMGVRAPSGKVKSFAAE